MKKVKSMESSWGFGFAVTHETPDRINGHLYEIIEALGLPEKQEASLKNIIQNKVWELFREAVYLSPETHSKLRIARFKEEEDSVRENRPTNAI